MTYLTGLQKLLYVLATVKPGYHVGWESGAGGVPLMLGPPQRHYRKIVMSILEICKRMPEGPQTYYSRHVLLMGLMLALSRPANDKEQTRVVAKLEA